MVPGKLPAGHVTVRTETAWFNQHLEHLTKVQSWQDQGLPNPANVKKEGVRVSVALARLAEHCVSMSLVGPRGCAENT